MAHPYHRTWDGKAKRAVYDHRAAAEEKLGRLLEPGEVVHHEDEDRENVDHDNLAVFASQRLHMLYHHYKRREAEGVTHLFAVEDYLKAMAKK